MKCILVIFSLLAGLLALVQGTAAVDCSYRIPDCMWTEEVDPVCGANGCNYGNPAKASCGGTTVAYKGSCV